MSASKLTHNVDHKVLREIGYEASEIPTRLTFRLTWIQGSRQGAASLSRATHRCPVTVMLKYRGRVETKPSPGEDFSDVENSTSTWSSAAKYARWWNWAKVWEAGCCSRACRKALGRWKWPQSSSVDTRPSSITARTWASKSYLI